MYAFILLILQAVSSIRVPLRRQARDGRQLASLEVNNYMNVRATQDQYYGVLNVGSPPQTLRVVFDTGFAWVLLPDLNCTGCLGAARFKGSKSFSYDATGTSISTTYARGVASGEIVKETIAVGGGESLRALNMPFFLARSMIIAENDRADGLVVSGMQGLGFSSRSDEFPTLIDTLKAQGIIKKRVFSFYFSDNGFEDNDDDDDSELTIGEVDESHADGTIEYFPLYDFKGYWSVQVGSVTLGTEITTSGYVLFDTASSLIVAPMKFDVLWYSFSCFWSSCPCSKEELINFPSLVFQFGGKQFALTPEDYFSIKLVKDTTYCVSLVRSGNEPYWVLGSVFLRKYFSVYDMDNLRIGLAESSSGNVALKVSAILSVLVFN